MEAIEGDGPDLVPPKMRAMYRKLAAQRAAEDDALAALIVLDLLAELGPVGEYVREPEPIEYADRTAAIVLDRG